MDKTKDVTDTFNHAIQLSERKNIIVTGVKKLDNFDENEFFAESIMGHILIKGGLRSVRRTFCKAFSASL